MDPNGRWGWDSVVKAAETVGTIQANVTRGAAEKVADFVLMPFKLVVGSVVVQAETAKALTSSEGRTQFATSIEQKVEAVKAAVATPKVRDQIAGELGVAVNPHATAIAQFARSKAKGATTGAAAKEAASTGAKGLPFREAGGELSKANEARVAGDLKGASIHVGRAIASGGIEAGMMAAAVTGGAGATRTAAAAEVATQGSTAARGAATASGDSIVLYHGHKSPLVGGTLTLNWQRSSSKVQRPKQAST